MEIIVKSTLVVFLEFGLSLSFQAKDIAGTVITAGSFNTPDTASDFAGLFDTLKGNRSFTV